MDPIGNACAGGFIEGTVDPGTGPLTSAQNGKNAFLACYRPNGSPYFADIFRTTRNGYSGIYDMAIDATGSIFVIGEYSDEINIGPRTFGPGGSVGIDIFHASFTNTGTLRWADTFGVDGYDRAQAIDVTVHGELVMGGEQYGTADFGGGPRECTGSCGWVAHYDSAGTHQRSWNIPKASVADVLQHDDALFVTGDLRGSTNFGGGEVVAEHGSVFVARYERVTGAFQWATVVHGGECFAGDLVISGDEVHSSLACTGSISAGDIAVDLSDQDAVWMTLDASDGSFRRPPWVSRMHGSEWISFQTVDSSGDIYFTLTHSEPIDVFGRTFANVGGTDAIIGRISPDGVLRWSRTIAGMSSDKVTDIALHGNRVLAVGYFSNQVDFGGQVRTAGDGIHVFVLSLSQ
jgi:hypothetical protein